jgi:hypothetical protein
VLRAYFLQNWYALRDPMAEKTLYDSELMRRFARIELGDDRIPDKTPILNVRYLLERPWVHFTAKLHDSQARPRSRGRARSGVS